MINSGFDKNVQELTKAQKPSTPAELVYIQFFQGLIISPTQPSSHLSQELTRFATKYCKSHEANIEV